MKILLAVLNFQKIKEEKMEKQKLYFIIGYAILTLFFIGCQSKTEIVVPNKVECVLFDFSETTNTQEIRKTYRDKFKMILGKMKHGDVIEAALITEKSVSELNLSIEHSFPFFSPSTDNDMLVKAEKRIADSLIQVQKDSLSKVVDSVLFKPSRKILNTEILSSLQVAERVLTSFPKPKKVLVIFSDMIEDSKYYNFERDDLSSQRINQIINRENKDSLLPNLSGVKIYVAGAVAKDTERYNRIKKFWLEYFKACNANLESQNYGAALIRFNE